MFGHDQDDNDKPNDDNQPDDKTANDVIKPSATDSSKNATDAKDGDDWQHPGPPPVDPDDSSDSNDSVGTSDSKPNDNDNAPAAPAPPLDISPPTASGGSKDDLIDLKREALTKLSPLVDKLDQAPDEKFRTLMMMIQASDDQSLVKEAYETAQKIDDEKERAQALLDIVNEINYFTQSSGS